MRTQRVFYFSLNIQHISQFNHWAGKMGCPLLLLEDYTHIKSVNDLPDILSKQDDLDCLYVILDYLSFFKWPNKAFKSIKKDDKEIEDLLKVADLLRRTILQYPEVDFLFDQSGLNNKWLSGLEFLLELHRESVQFGDIVQCFHIFRNDSDNPFFFLQLDYDNLFDGTNLRAAIKKKQYARLNANQPNFSKIQNSRESHLAMVVDDEQRQSRFNSYALFASGYRVIPVNTARMLMAINSSVHEGWKSMTPDIVIRDFDLQFPDAMKSTDYKVDPYIYLKVPSWNKDSNTSWSLTWKDTPIPLQACYDKMIDYIRDYRYYEQPEKNEDHWSIAPLGSENLFWGDIHKKGIPVFVITNGHDLLKVRKRILECETVNDGGEKEKYTIPMQPKKNGWLEVAGLLKPISGLYHPFFTHFKQKGASVVETIFSKTRYDLKDYKEYEIDKRRLNHNHGVPVNIYGTVDEMLRRASDYYEKAHYVKSAILAEETIELLNGFHWQMMIRAYQIKAKAENAIAMDVVGADEEKLVLDALLRIEMVKQDIRRMVFPLFKGKSLKDQIKRRKKERQLLEYIYSDCRKACHDNEYFDVEAIYISAMAHLDEYDLGVIDIGRYLSHRWFLWKRNKLVQKESQSS